MDDLRVGRALLNGLFVWLLSLAVYLVPVFAYVFARSMQLSPATADYGALGEQIAGEVSTIFAENWLLVIALVAITAVLTLWRARAVAQGTWHLRWLNGLIVGIVPAVLSLLFTVCGGFDVLDAITIGVYVLMGLLGGLVARPA